MIIELADEEQNRGKIKESATFQTPNRRKLQDVLFCFSGGSPKLLKI